MFLLRLPLLHLYHHLQTKLLLMKRIFFDGLAGCLPGGTYTEEEDT